MKISQAQEFREDLLPSNGTGISLQQPLLDPLQGIELSSTTNSLSPKEQDKEITDLLITPNLNRLKAMPMRKTKIRWVALFLAALLMFGNNYSFDNPQALQKPIMEKLDISSPKYNLLYSVFSFPNIFLTLAGGFMIDLLGVRIGIIFFSTTVLLSQLIVAFGGKFKLFWLMLLGRGFFGVSSENLIISQSAIVAQWFRGSELSVAIGIIMTVPEIGSAMNSFFTPLIYDKTDSLAWPLLVSVAICFISLLCSILLAYIDFTAEKQLNELNDMEDLVKDEQKEIEERVSFKDIKEFTATFWILLLICALTLGIYIPFLDDANDFYQEKFKFTQIESGRLLIIPYIMSAITSPFIGTYVDKVGKRRLFICLTCILFTVSCFLFGILEEGQEYEIDEQLIQDPNWLSILPLILLGLSFSFYSCVIIPSVQYIIPQRVMGTAFGLMGSLESIALATFPLIAASIVTSSRSDSEGYSRVGFFYAGICTQFSYNIINKALIGLILALSLYFFDQRGSIILDFVIPEEPTEEEALLLKRYRRESEESSSDSEDEEEEEKVEEDEQSQQSSESLQSQTNEEIQLKQRSSSYHYELRQNMEKIVNGDDNLLNTNNIKPNSAPNQYVNTLNKYEDQADDDYGI